MSTAKDFYTHLMETLDRVISRAMPFRATVDSTPNGRVKIIPLEAGTALGEEYARLTGFRLNAGDEVAVITMSGKPFILGKVQRSTPTTRTIDGPTTIETGNPSALIVKNDTKPIFLVNTNAPQVSFRNGVYIPGYSDDGVTSTWAIDSTNGNARFDGNITARSINSPVITVNHQSGADTASTTSTTVYSSAISQSIALPAGTWTVYVLGGAQLLHSASGSVAFKVTCGGTDGTAINPSFTSTVYGVGAASGTFAGKSGTVEVTFSYRSSTAGTSSCKNPWVFIAATRTS